LMAYDRHKLLFVVSLYSILILTFYFNGEKNETKFNNVK